MCSDRCVCKEVDEMANQGNFELSGDLLVRYIENKVSRIKRLQEAQKTAQKFQKTVDILENGCIISE